jgi:hypothetical protein
VSNARCPNEFDIIVIFEAALFNAKGHVIMELGRKRSIEGCQPENTVKMNSEVQGLHLGKVIVYITS